ncbi:hypothetical protein DFS34DRAFT_646275 [Phlyctochytrium arcticum]|nr:hypothetical protein DFS34DRAFT_646275 [Phlyctochytrium arcticum]
MSLFVRQGLLSSLRRPSPTPLFSCRPASLLLQAHRSRRHFIADAGQARANLRYDGDQPFLTVTLPNGNSTAFRVSSVKPISFLLEQIREEDPAVKEVAVYDLPSAPGRATGFRWARATQTANVLQRSLRRGGLVLMVNSQPIRVRTPPFAERVKDIEAELATVEEQLLPLKETKAVLDKKASKSSVRIAWIGLGALCAQWGIMARLTWWEYSWDVMEPISYFIGAGTGILGYMFYVVTSKEYTYQALAEVTVTKHQSRLYKRANFDIAKLFDLERKADRLRDRLVEIRDEYEGSMAPAALADVLPATADGVPAPETVSTTVTPPSAEQPKGPAL